VPSSGTPYIRLVQVRAPTSEALPALLLEVPVEGFVPDLFDDQWFRFNHRFSRNPIEYSIIKHGYPPIGREH
jgi:hypothetical protein